MTKKLYLLLFISIFIVLSFIYLHKTDSFDQDLGRHLTLGKIITEEKSVPTTNRFSYTNPNERVINSHWGSEVVFYKIYLRAGITGLLLFSTLINTLALGSIVWLAIRKRGSILSLLLLFPFLFILFDRTMIRPEMFGNLFFAFLVCCLYLPKLREKGKFFFPVIALLWINLHISAVLGILVMGVVLLQDLLEARSKQRTILINGILGIVSILALFINPNGVDGVFFIFNWSSKYGYTIVENQSIAFLLPFGFELVNHIVLGMILFGVCLLLRFVTKKKLLVGEVLLLLVVTVITGLYVRNEIFFGYTAYLASVFSFPDFLRYEKTHVRNTLGIGLAFSCLLFFIINGYFTAQKQPLGISNSEKYQAGVNYFVENKLHGPIFNNFDIGGYLIYRLYPKEKVFVDNRPEAYPVSFFQETYIPMQKDPQVFKELEKQYNFQTVIWGVEDMTEWSQSFLASLQADKDWKLVYNDQKTAIFSRAQ